MTGGAWAGMLYFVSVDRRLNLAVKLPGKLNRMGVNQHASLKWSEINFQSS